MNTLRMSFADAGDSASVRGEAAGLLAPHPPEIVHDVLLVITELIDNVVQHTPNGGEVTVIPGAETVRIEVHDSSSVLPEVRRPGPRQAGGRGLLLVAAVTRSWGSSPTPTGKVVWAQVDVPAS